ncbi:hypothetical protein [Nocardia mexicana]|uniref:Uncharacterized protein n=1 Tax=Nocardia mexicana TaxID=279262 RepID=A0A370H558_9NOCA|nr:hypothetical protein [Nocardia mexicana]RDI50898.1 hypothetical protein DFR68_105375 [Nocardia mexicana]
MGESDWASAAGPFPPDWSQAVPDLLVGACTGLVIGVVLAYAQHRRDLGQRRRDTRRAWDRLQAPLRPLFDGRMQPEVGRWIDEERIRRILLLLEGQPIQEWARDLADPTLAALVRLERNLNRIAHITAVVDEQVVGAVRRLRPPHIPITRLNERHREAVQAVRAVLFGIPISHARILNDHGSPEQELADWARIVLADTEIARHIAEFTAVRTAVDRDVLAISTALADNDGLGL